jgi:hypothetical protein
MTPSIDPSLPHKDGFFFLGQGMELSLAHLGIPSHGQDIAGLVSHGKRSGMR